MSDDETSRSDAGAIEPLDDPDERGRLAGTGEGLRTDWRWLARVETRHRLGWRVVG